MAWIRIDTAMKGDPRVGAMADAIDAPVPATVGLLACLFMELPQHARAGDVTDVPASTLETWAMWTGPRGAFAAAFRAHLCEIRDGRQVVRAWDKHNGAPLRELDAKRDEMARRRADAKVGRVPPTAPPPPRPVTPTHPERGGNGSGTLPECSALTVTVKNKSKSNSKNKEQEHTASAVAADAAGGARRTPDPAPPDQALVAAATAPVEAPPVPPPPAPPASPASKSAPWMGEFRPWWRARYQAEPPSYAVKVLRPLVDEHGIADVLVRLGRYCDATPASALNLHKFPTIWGAYGSDAPARPGRRDEDAELRERVAAEERSVVSRSIPPLAWFSEQGLTPPPNHPELVTLAPAPVAPANGTNGTHPNGPNGTPHHAAPVGAGRRF